MQNLENNCEASTTTTTCTDTTTTCCEGGVCDIQWKKETSLTTPSERDRTKPYQLKGGISALNDEQTMEAMNTLVDKRVIEKFPMVDRVYCDPPVPMQNYCIFSFVPAKGATPDKDGFYGFAKVRGSYATIPETEERTEFLLRNVDSYHKYYTCYVGRPFPVTLSSDYSQDSVEIDVRKKAAETVSENIKRQKQDEQKQIKEIKDREKMLVDDTTNKKEENPYDRYTELKVKKAQLTFTYLEHTKKLAEIKEIIIKTKASLAEMDTENSDYGKRFYDKYMDARRESGLPTTDESFIRYLNEDADLGF